MQASSQRTVFIRKTTAVWLLQESEHVSSDRLFRVRSKQPYSSESNKLLLSTENINENLHVSTLVSLGELCAFMDKDNYKLGRVLQFANSTDKSSKYTQQYKYSAEISVKNIGGTMYDFVPGSTRSFQVSQSTLNVYCPLASYI